MDRIDAIEAPDAPAPDAAPDPVEHATGLPASTLLLAATAAALAACGGGSDSDGTAPAPPPPAPPPPPPPAPAALTDRDAARFLLHGQVAATTADIAAVRKQGYAGWLDAQFATPIAQTAWDWNVTKGYTAIDGFGFFDGGAYVAEFGIAQQVITAPDAVRKRVALALSEFFVVSLNGLNMTWPHMAVAHYWDLLNTHAFGSFRALLEAVTLSAAMGAYLNTRGNAKADASGRVPDENYAREVMQLFTIGLVQLNSDGTPKRDGKGKPLPTYTQGEVTQLARVFTGWDWWDDGRFFINPFDGYPRVYEEYARRPMVLNEDLHSPERKRFLGTTIAAGTSGEESLRIALDALAAHPNVGPFFGRQMIQRLVTSNPSPAYVARVAAAFDDNGSGVRGDLKAVWRAILLDDEARGAAGLTSTTHGKLREPMLRVYQWARTFGARSAAGSWKWAFDTGNSETWYGQRPFWSPSVFNFFRPGYVPPGTALARSGATAPEFQIMNESSVSQWINAIEGIAQLGVYVVWPDKPGYPDPYEGPYPQDGFDITVNHDAELAIAHDAPALVARLNLLLAAGQLSTATVTRIAEILVDETPITASSPVEWKRARIGAALTLVMSAPEYIVQK